MKNGHGTIFLTELLERSFEEERTFTNVKINP